MKLSTIIPWIVTTIILVLVVTLLVKINNKVDHEVAYWRAKTFKTDTVFSETEYRVRVPYPEYMPPEVVEVTKEVIPKAYLEVRDSLIHLVNIIKNQRDSLLINNRFLSLHPRSSKLVGAFFTKDSVILDLLDINGQITIQKYPVDYSRFKYLYSNSSMSVSEYSTTEDINKPKNRIISYNGLYLNHKYDFHNKFHGLNAEIGLNIWKFRVQGFGEVPLGSNIVPAQYGIKTGFRLF